jgi:hypothetical protein
MNKKITIVTPSNEIKIPEPMIIVASNRNKITLFHPPTGGKFGAAGTFSKFRCEGEDSASIVFTWSRELYCLAHVDYCSSDTIERYSR